MNSTVRPFWDILSDVPYQSDFHTSTTLTIFNEDCYTSSPHRCCLWSWDTPRPAPPPTRWSTTGNPSKLEVSIFTTLDSSCTHHLFPIRMGRPGPWVTRGKPCSMEQHDSSAISLRADHLPCGPLLGGERLAGRAGGREGSGKEVAQPFFYFFVSTYVYLFILFSFLHQVAQLGEQHEGGRRRLHSLGLPLGHAQ